MCLYSQIVHHNPCFNIFMFRQTVCNENFLPTTHLIDLHLVIIALVLDFIRNRRKTD